MGDRSHIQWTDATWNPTTGCSKVKSGCKNCYALREWARLSAPRTPPNVYTGRKFTDVRTHDDRLDQPLRWTKPRRVFVNSMSDLFHKKVPDEFIDRVFAVMAQAHQHTYQVLTKRAERMREYLTRRASAVEGTLVGMRIMDARLRRKHLQFMWPLPNVWLGVSVEDQATADERIPLLLRTPAAVRFVSYEPAIGRVDFCETFGMWWNSTMRAFESSGAQFNRPNGRRGIDWVIVGGESGPKARACDLAWIRSTVQQCKAAGVPCFVKQAGARPILDCPPGEENEPQMRPDGSARYWTIAMKDRKGGDMAEWPEDLRVREFPKC
ncbi:MAG: phage Gp37/Gp68 family protein [Burkholderiales bacterium]|nr:phage Gp37/Gp68 family protein [Burkholderiales bacterium]